MGSINSSNRRRMSGSLDLGTSQQEGLATGGERERANNADDNPDGGEGLVVNDDPDDIGSDTHDLSTILAYLIRR